LLFRGNPAKATYRTVSFIVIRVLIQSLTEHIQFLDWCKSPVVRVFSQPFIAIIELKRNTTMVTHPTICHHNNPSAPLDHFHLCATPDAGRIRKGLNKGRSGRFREHTERREDAGHA
jgi:hypothetical protein